MHQLSERQMEIARLIDEGLTYAEIGQRLGISERTAKAHTDKLRWSLGVQKKRQIPKVMRDLGLLP